MNFNTTGQSLIRTSSQSSVHTEEKSSDSGLHHQTHSTIETSSENFASFINYGKKCKICEKNFLFRKKYLCKLCNNYVCSEHFSKVRNNENVCDFCDKKEAKRLIRLEIEKEIQFLAFELDKSKDLSNRAHREYCEKIAEFHKCENEFARIIDELDSRKSMLLGRIANQRYRTQKNSELLENSKKFIQESSISEKEMNAKYGLVQKQLLEVSTQLSEIKIQKNELSQELETRLNGDIKTKSFIVSKLCSTCQAKLKLPVDHN